MMLEVLLNHLLGHLSHRRAKIPSSVLGKTAPRGACPPQKCRPQYRFFNIGNSSNSLAALRPLSRRMISLGAIVGGALTRIQHFPQLYAVISCQCLINP